MAPESLGSTRPVETVATKTGLGGHFEFDEVPPGNYVVGVGLER